MTANGQQVQPGDLVLGGHRSPNLAECLQLGYLIPTEEAELTDEERDDIAAEEEGHLAAQRQRLLDENPGMLVANAGEGHPDGQPDAVMQDSGRLRELREGMPVVEAARRSAERGAQAAAGGVTPAAEERARELGVDLDSVEGTGQDGRVTKADVEAAAVAGSPSPDSADETDDDDVLAAALAKQAQGETTTKSEKGGTPSGPASAPKGQGGAGGASPAPRTPGRK
jgi:pyruvate/2-oxoglutarate dehydrogenase complex dihydrolipoamide acyltransferase (E2) component